MTINDNIKKLSSTLTTSPLLNIHSRRLEEKINKNLDKIDFVYQD